VTVLSFERELDPSEISGGLILEDVINCSFANGSRGKKKDVGGGGQGNSGRDDNELGINTRGKKLFAQTAGQEGGGAQCNGEKRKKKEVKIYRKAHTSETSLRRYGVIEAV